MATTINISCTDQVLTITNSPVISSGGLGEDTVKFTFCNKWTAFARTAVFYRDEAHVYHAVLDELDECVIPHEVLADSGVVYIGVFGVDSEDTIRTSNVLTYRVCKGAITTATEITDPTPDIYAQILASYADVTAKAKFFYECTDAEIDDVFNGDYVPESMDDPATRQTVETEVTDARGGYTTLDERLDEIYPADEVYSKTESDTLLAQKVPKTDIVDNLTTDNANKPLSAKQGKILNDRKANIDGSYDQFEAGTAKNLTGKGDSVPASFTHRTAGGSDDISDGTATIDKLKGNTIVWNQLFSQYVGSSYASTDGLTFTVNANGTYNLVGTTTGEYDKRLTTVYGIQSGHKYLVKASKGLRFYVDFQGGASSGLANYGTWATEFISTSPLQTTTLVMRAWMRYAINTTVDITNGNIIVFDLTQMFGAGNEPTTVEEFTSLFQKDYYEYNAGELLSFNATGIKTVGFNQIPTNNTWVQGRIEVGNVITLSAEWVSMTSYVPIFGNTKYQFTAQNSFNSYRFMQYDENQNLLNYFTSTPANGEVTTLANARFARITLIKVGGIIPSDMNKACIHLVWSGIRNGDFEEYWTQTRALPIETYFPNGMRSAGVAFDELTKDKAITRIGAVDMGSLGWVYSNSRFIASLGSKLAGSLNVLCTKYKTITLAELLGGSDKSISADPGNGLYVRDSAYTTAAAFKTAMSGVMLYYELATPTEVTIDPVLNLSYQVADWGTEEILSDATTEPKTAPSKFETVYGQNYPDTIRNLDVNYTNIGTLDSLLSALGTACNGTFTKGSFNEVTRSYPITFTPNAQEG